MIEFFTPTFDLDGVLVVKATIDRSAISRRSRRVPTLDGGAVLSDLGYSVKDEDYNVKISRSSREQLDWFADKIAIYPSIVMSSEFGAFSVLLKGIKHSNGEITFTAQVLEKLFE